MASLFQADEERREGVKKRKAGIFAGLPLPDG